MSSIELLPRIGTRYVDQFNGATGIIKAYYFEGNDAFAIVELDSECQGFVKTETCDIHISRIIVHWSNLPLQ